MSITEHSTPPSATTEAIVETPPSVQVISRDGDRVLVLSGSWTVRSVGKIDEVMRAIEPIEGRTVLDFADVQRLDTAGVWLIDRFSRRVGEKGEVAATNIRPTLATLVRTITEMPDRVQPSRPKRGPSLRAIAESVGEGVVNIYTDVRLGLVILGAAISGQRTAKEGGSGLGITPVVAQIDQMMVKAVPIVGLMSFLIGAIVAQQGAFQLRFVAGQGSEIFAVDLVSILLLREVGVMLTAIMVAGRTGSAITAEIGSMRMREEVDALQVMGLNPIQTLIFPRLTALAISLPLLTVVSSFFALIGGGLVLFLYAGLPISLQIAQLAQAIDFTTIFAGIIKAPFMALIIGIVASLEGLQVGGSAESLGRRVTAAVVKSIFLVIFVDGMFAIFYAQIGF